MKYIFNLISFFTFFSVAFLTMEKKEGMTYGSTETVETCIGLDNKNFEAVEEVQIKTNIYPQSYENERKVFSDFSEILKKNYSDVLDIVDTLPCYKNYFQKRKQEFINMGNFLDQKKDNNNKDDRKYILEFISIAIEKLKEQKTLAQYFDESKLIDQMGEIINRNTVDYELLFLWLDQCEQNIKLYSKLKETLKKKLDELNMTENKNSKEIEKRKKKIGNMTQEEKEAINRKMREQRKKRIANMTEEQKRNLRKNYDTDPRS